jgi:hypothetical protein
VLSSGERIDLERYAIESGVLHVTVNGQARDIPLSALDMKATIAENRQRGIELKIPGNRSEVLLAF